MSEQEFEVYLRLIAKLLRLSDKQREAISDELRDHMEARLDELMDAGMDREQAIHAAVEEFGDAAGLADQFTRITRHYNLRRRIMRTSIGALAAAAAIALSFLFMLPQHRPGISGPADTMAQDARLREEPAGARTGEDELVSATYQAADTVKALSKRIDVEFQETPLEAVIDYLRETAGVNVFVNWNAIESAGMHPDYAVSLKLKQTKANTVFALLIQLVKPMCSEPIDYAVMDDVVVVSTESEIDDMRVVRIYDCLDLMKQGEVAQASATIRHEPDAASAGSEGGSVGRSAGGGGGYGEMGAYGGMGMGMGGGYGGEMMPGGAYGMGYASETFAHRDSGDLINVVGTLLDDGGSVSFYDGMLVVVAGHKTHQRIQETLNLMREAKAKR